jgi:uncharacterized protein (TIGR03435 family)
MNTRAGIIVVALTLNHGLAGAPSLRAQSLSKFDAASVRRVDIPPVAGGVPVFPPVGGVGTGRIAYRGTWLMGLISEAFGVRADQISGTAWTQVRSERYDIVANIPHGATKDDFKRMLQDLLVDRFGLRFHMGSTTRPIYALRVGTGGAKVKPTERRVGDGINTSAGIRPGGDERGCPSLPSDYQGMVSLPAAGAICWTAQDVPVADLAGVLERPAGRPIIDETGLTGRYDFKIWFEFTGRAGDSGVLQNRAPNVFTAVQEQLGLRLEPATRSFPEFVIDSIQRDPREN